MISPKFLIVDLFCGAGGTTTGFSMAERNGYKLAKIIACVNHDPKAIKSHWLNHPEVLHYEEDIRTLDLRDLVDTVQYWQLVYPDAKLILWASLECTNFSKAKGGQARDADSRTLADHLGRYVTAINPDYVQIENVVEFRSWGPLWSKVKKSDEGYDCCEVGFKPIYGYDEYGEFYEPKWIRDKSGLLIDENETREQKIIGYRAAWHGVPENNKSGTDWLRWRSEICEMGYYDEWREMNSADFGAYTSRNRLFGCFARPGLPIEWPESTHAKVKKNIANSRLAPWMPVKDVLDFDDEGNSIFNRKKDLSPKTLDRIYAGLIKYVAGGKDAFLLKYNSVSQTGKHVPPSVDDPCPTIAVQNRLGMCFITKYFSGRPEGKVIPVSGPAGTISCSANQSLVQCFLAKYYGASGQVSSQDEPAGTLTTKARMAKIWLDKTYTGAANHQSISQPAGVIMPNDKHQMVQASWLDRNFSNGGQHSSIETAAGSLMTVPKMNLVTADPFIMQTSYGNVGTPIDQPAPPLLASRRHHYIVNPSHGGHSTSVDNPCPVIIARQDKAPLYLIEATCASVMIPIYEGDPQVMVDIKIFMAMYGIADIKMRMLKVPELLKIQGFPDNYKLEGNQSDQKKFIGNSVHPFVPKAWLERLGTAVDRLTEAA